MGQIMDSILKNQAESYETLRLVASENLPGIKERLPFLLDMFARYSFGQSDTWRYPTFFLDDIERETEALFGKLLNCRHISLKPISGLNGMLAAISAFTQPGDIVLSLSPDDGGHLETANVVRKLGLQSEYLPFDQEAWSIDLERLEKMEAMDRVQVVYIDLCMVAFPQPVQALRKVLNKKTILIYDASHVLGLILGGQFQNPLDEGADIMIANTHKTFPGPHKAIYATNRKLLKWQFDQNSARFVSHHHMADVACLGLILENYGEEGFRKYARAVVDNARLLAQLLHQAGVGVQLERLGFTACHQIWIECGAKEQVDDVIDLCSRVNIIVNGGLIPSLGGGWGIRIGVQEITHRGIGERGIRLVAQVLADIILHRLADAQTIRRKDEILHSHMDIDKERSMAENLVDLLAGRKG